MGIPDAAVDAHVAAIFSKLHRRGEAAPPGREERTPCVDPAACLPDLVVGQPAEDTAIDLGRHYPIFPPAACRAGGGRAGRRGPTIRRVDAHRGNGAFIGDRRREAASGRHARDRRQRGKRRKHDGSPSVQDPAAETTRVHARGLAGRRARELHWSSRPRSPASMSRRVPRVRSRRSSRPTHRPCPRPGGRRGWETEWSQLIGADLLAQLDSSGEPAWDTAAHPLVYISAQGPGYGSVRLRRRLPERRPGRTRRGHHRCHHPRGRREHRVPRPTASRPTPRTTDWASPPTASGSTRRAPTPARICAATAPA